MSTRVIIDSLPYVRSHGKLPRGRGSWAFATTPNPDVLSPAVIWKQGTFAEARRAAIAEYLRRDPSLGLGLLYVLP
jgi:hypothetical protein